MSYEVRQAIGVALKRPNLSVDEILKLTIAERLLDLSDAGFAKALGGPDVFELRKRGFFG